MYSILKSELRNFEISTYYEISFDIEFSMKQKIEIELKNNQFTDQFKIELNN